MISLRDGMGSGWDGFLMFFSIWQLEASRCVQNNVRGCANIFHYRKPDSENSFVLESKIEKCVHFSPNRFICRGSGGVGCGPVVGTGCVAAK